MKSLSNELNKEEVVNEFDIFDKHVAVQLRYLTEEQAITAQQEIQAILTRYRLKKIRNEQQGTSSFRSQSRQSDFQYITHTPQCYESPNSPFSVIVEEVSSSRAQSSVSDVQYIANTPLSYQSPNSMYSEIDKEQDMANEQIISDNEPQSEREQQIDELNIINIAFQNT